MLHLATALAWAVAAAALLRAAYVVLYVPLSLRRRLGAQGVPAAPFVPVLGINLRRRRNRAADRALRTMYQAFEEDAGGGRSVVMSLGWWPRLFTRDPGVALDVLSRRARSFGKPALMRTLLGPFLGEGLVVSNGELWRRQRAAMTPAFRFESVRQMVGLMDCGALLDRLWAGAAAAEGGLAVDLPGAMSELTLNVVARAAFGSDAMEDHATAEAVKEVFTVAVPAHVWRLMNAIGAVPLLRSLPTRGKRDIDRCVRRLAREAERLVDDRRQGRTRSRVDAAHGGKDLLDLLLEARDAEGRPMAQRQLLDEMNTLVLAGHETTSTLLGWTLYEMLSNRAVWELARDEVDAVLGADGAPTLEAIRRMPYVAAVVSEGLRAHPPVVAVTREALEDVEVRPERGPPVRLRRGDLVSVAIECLHHDPEYWERPGEFWPDRWLGTRRRPRPPAAFCPFALGPRSCIGSKFAELEAHAILCRVLQRYDVRLEPGQKVVPHPSVTRGFKYGLRARVTPRRRQ